MTQDQIKNESRNYHSTEADQVIGLFKSAKEGISQDEAARRLEEYGPNSIGDDGGANWLHTLLAQILNPLVYVLFIAALVSILVGHAVDAYLILAIVILNTIIGFIQEYKAENAMAELARMSAPRGNVRRDGRVVEVEACNVVPGDILILAAGDKVAADARIIEAANMEVDEAALTGESQPVEKAAETLEMETPLAERKSMVFSGTNITRGRGEAIIVSTGIDTEFGHIAAQVRDTERQQTPLQHQLAEVGRNLGIIAIGLSGLIFVLGLLRQEQLMDMFFTGVAMAVAAIPEGLPAVVTIALAIGLKEMARKNAIIRRLPAVEALGSATVIMSDKTGTLTQNKMTVETVYVTDTDEEIVGGEMFSSDTAKEVLVGGSLVNDSAVSEENGVFRGSGDPTEAAIVVAAAKAGEYKDALDKKCPRIAELPFESERGYMATVHNCSDGKYIFLKGSPERVVEMCSQSRKGALDDNGRKKLEEKNVALASRALRVLAVACRKVDDDFTGITTENVGSDFVHLGFVGMIDPPRPEAIEAVETCRKAGIRVIMATGDNHVTAMAIGMQFGLVDDDSLVVGGMELKDMSDEELLEKLPKISIFSRMEPIQKLRIVKHLKEQSHIVAMTGDGVNDAPALKTSDIGIAMGITGTGVARESSDMVLSDDNFATIVSAVEQGRIVFDRIRKVVTYLVATNAGELLTIGSAIVMGMHSPLTPVQILWVNLVTDSLPCLALAADPPASDVLARPPRDESEKVLGLKSLPVLLPIAAIMAVAALVAYKIGLASGDVQRAHTLAFITLSVSQFFNALNVRSRVKSIFTLPLFANKWLVWAILAGLGLQALPIYVPALQAAFEVQAIGLNDWLMVLGLSSCVLWVEEIRKIFVRLSGRKPYAKPARD